MSARVTEQDVRHVAMLARLGVSDERATALARELSTILDHMQVLEQVDTADAASDGHADSHGMRLRADKGPPIPLLEPPSAFAPEMEDGLFLVPRLATYEDAELES